jgi:parallel beta-helix repeat protein
LNSNDCLLVGNNVCKSCCGIRLESSPNNTLYLNSLRDNRDHNAYDDGINLWDNGREGNYYQDYVLSKGGCKPTGNICTLPYHIPGGSSVDRYPLAKEETGI